MKSFTHSLYTLVLVFTLVACKSTDLRSEDFSKENDFTPGIEGPAVNKEGDLFAVNFQKEGTIGKVDANGVGSIFATLPEGSIGNGIRFDLEGNMFIADYNGHKVYKIAKGTNEPVVWAENDSMNQPNDLVISEEGYIYLSDPNWADNTGNLWMVTPEKEVVLLEDNMGTTNGIEISPDNAYLYVNESVQRLPWQRLAGFAQLSLE